MPVSPTKVTQVVVLGGRWIKFAELDENAAKYPAEAEIPS